MITARDAVMGIYGAWRLLLFDRSGLQYIDSTIDGFWKSFYAAVVALPGVYILRLLFLDTNPEVLAETGTARIVLVFAIDYAYQWILFPLVMFSIAEAIGCSRHYVTFIVARNWSQILQIAIVLPAAALFAAGSSDEPGIGPLVLLAAYAVTWVYAWFIARTALDLSRQAATVIVLVELAISVSISIFSELLIGSL